KKEYPETIFLAEAFTRPKVMYRLAKAGFTQSYTYFTWRNTKDEFKEYLTELTKRDAREFYRPNFWTNTPDILPENLQFGGRAAFISRFVLAATLSSNYGIYGPAYEVCNITGIEEKEEYMNSEKYEIKFWDRDKPGNIKDVIKKVNIIRKENAALQTTYNIEFYDSDNRYLLCYGKVSEDKSNIIVVVVNLNFFHKQSGSVKIPIKKLGIPEKQSYLVHELLSGKRLMWQGSENFVELDPETSPANMFKIYKRLRREDDFDYFM
ncbi:MAG: alpha-1,4-glucan--maltose-1-phosphate maltosyltransferase, partial [Ignavibacteria bacterium]|nr:alpha-1,4-glucan--maltose-1-phosphate maltosyltransferase [Ignavibacteria bacterium]